MIKHNLENRENKISLSKILPRIKLNIFHIYVKK